MGRLSLRDAERRGVANGDVERSGRAISDARYVLVAQRVRGMTNRAPIDDGASGYCRGTSKNARTGQLVSKLSAVSWRRQNLVVRRSL